MDDSVFVAAIDALEMELRSIDHDLEALAREQMALQARRPRVLTAISTLRELRVVPDARGGRGPGDTGVTTTPPAAPAPPAHSRAVAPADRRVLKFLADHPASRPGDVRNALEDFVPNFRDRLKSLIESGLVIATGATANRRVSISDTGLLAMDPPPLIDAAPGPDAEIDAETEADADAETDADDEAEAADAEAQADADDADADAETTPRSTLTPEPTPPTGRPRSSAVTTGQQLVEARDAAVLARVRRGRSTFGELLTVMPTTGLAVDVDGVRETALRQSLRRLVVKKQVVDVGQYFTTVE